MHAVSATPSAVDLPRTFGRYRLFELIGKGGMAQIYLAREETELGATRLAVVKEIMPAFADDPRFADMLIHEAKLAARLSHRHIVQVFDLGRAGDRLFIAMEYVEGFDLNALLRRCTEMGVGLPAQHALGIVADVVSGLDYAHRQKDEFGVPLGIVHRDVSPSNVLISYEGEVKLCDFGIAHANDLVRENSTEALKGKAGYMSPEHARGEAIDARADVFASGIILWELLSGRRLYRPRSEVSLLEQARLAEIPKLVDKGLPNHEELESIVMRALAKEREARYPSAAALLKDLDHYLAASNLLASRLKLGEWMAASFGTTLIEERRASERRLPKSAPPRFSQRVRKQAGDPEGHARTRANAHAAHGVGVADVPDVFPRAPALPSVRALDAVDPAAPGDGRLRRILDSAPSAPKSSTVASSESPVALETAPSVPPSSDPRRTVSGWAPRDSQGADAPVHPDGASLADARATPRVQNGDAISNVAADVAADLGATVSRGDGPAAPSDAARARTDERALTITPTPSVPITTAVRGPLFVKARVPIEPGSLAGAAFDVPPSSRSVLDAARPTEPLSRCARSEGEPLRATPTRVPRRDPSRAPLRALMRRTPLSVLALLIVLGVVVGLLLVALVRG